MDVQGVGPGPTGADRASPARGFAPPANAPAARNTPIAADSVAVLLRDLSQADLTRLLGAMETDRGPGQDAQAGQLLQAALTALAEHNPGGALDILKHLSVIDPARAETLPSEPELASARPAVEQMLAQLTAAAKLRAESRVAEAVRWLETAAGRETPVREVGPEIYVLVATRLIEAGGLANYVRSAAVSGLLVDEPRWAPAPHAEVPTASPAHNESRLPLRWLVAAWLALGLAAGGICWWLQIEHLEITGAIWAGGLLVLACFSAWQRMRF